MSQGKVICYDGFKPGQLVKLSSGFSLDHLSYAIICAFEMEEGKPMRVKLRSLVDPENTTTLMASVISKADLSINPFTYTRRCEYNGRERSLYYTAISCVKLGTQVRNTGKFVVGFRRPESNEPGRNLTIVVQDTRSKDRLLSYARHDDF